MTKGLGIVEDISRLTQRKTIKAAWHNIDLLPSKTMEDVVDEALKLLDLRQSVGVELYLVQLKMLNLLSGCW